MKLKWTIEITIDESWVADGFDFDDDRLDGLLNHLVPYALSHERSARVVKMPPPGAIDKLQNEGVPEYDAVMDAEGK